MVVQGELLVVVLQVEEVLHLVAIQIPQVVVVVKTQEHLVEQVATQVVQVKLAITQEKVEEELVELALVITMPKVEMVVEVAASPKKPSLTLMEMEQVIL